MRKLLFLSLFSMGTCLAQAQDGFWKQVSESALPQDAFASRVKPAAYKLYQLNANSFAGRLAGAPSERMTNAASSGFIISVPNADGVLEQFSVVEAPVMHPDLAARYPNIKSYAGKGITQPNSTIRFDMSPRGFHAMILSPDRSTIYIDPVGTQTGNYYTVFSRKDAAQSGEPFRCGTEDHGHAAPATSGVGNRNADDGRLRTYRLALAATGEYSQYFLNGTETSDAERKAKVLAAQNTAITRVNGIYERDFGVRVILIANNDAIIYLNASTDPWTTNLNGVTQTTIDNVIGSANYDVGHLAHRASNNGNAGFIGCVCVAGRKGSAFTSTSIPEGDIFAVDYLAHEMGHQFGAYHTMTSILSGNGTTETEPGSGSTIMAYAGVNGAQPWVQNTSDDFFHAKSIENITNYIKTATGGGCALTTITGNATPTANAGADFTIPRSTPFVLTGTGTDADASDVLTYTWEQINPWANGSSVSPSATATTGPAFRSVRGTASPARSFPNLASVLGGTNANTWEVLPSVARTMTFRLTVRDNHPGGGNNNSDDVVVTVSGTTGPFAVTAPNTAVTWGEGTNQTVSWSVNGTNGAPVNCANVNILLSTDGGTTFNTLLANTPNDGSEVVTLPLGQSATCRIKVEAVGNIFYDISNTNFAIGAAPLCSDVNGLTSSAITQTAATISWSAVSGATNYDVDYKAASSATWINAATGTTATSVNLSALTAATAYDWRVRANCAAGAGNYAQAQFTTAAPPNACPGTLDVSTNGTIAGAATIPFNTDVKGLINPAGDLDYYRFVITTGGTATITLTTLPANYDLRLYNSSGSLITSSRTNGTNNETISRTYTPGTYYARVEGRNNANNATNCYTLRVQLGTAARNNDITEVLNENNGVQVFPNPASDVLQVNIGAYESGSVIRVFDVHGRLMLQQNAMQQNTRISIGKLPAGVYMLRVQNGGKLISSGRFVKE